MKISLNLIKLTIGIILLTSSSTAQKLFTLDDYSASYILSRFDYPEATKAGTAAWKKTNKSITLKTKASLKEVKVHLQKNKLFTSILKESELASQQLNLDDFKTFLSILIKRIKELKKVSGSWADAETVQESAKELIAVIKYDYSNLKTSNNLYRLLQGNITQFNKDDMTLNTLIYLYKEGTLIDGDTKHIKSSYNKIPQEVPEKAFSGQLGYLNKLKKEGNNRKRSEEEIKQQEEAKKIARSIDTSTITRSLREFSKVHTKTKTHFTDKKLTDIEAEALIPALKNACYNLYFRNSYRMASADMGTKGVRGLADFWEVYLNAHKEMDGTTNRYDHDKFVEKLRSQYVY